jgi:hypothetical protein
MKLVNISGKNGNISKLQTNNINNNKGTAIPVTAMEAHTVVRCRGSHIF